MPGDTVRSLSPTSIVAVAWARLRWHKFTSNKACSAMMQCTRLHQHHLCCNTTAFPPTGTRRLPTTPPFRPPSGTKPHTPPAGTHKCAPIQEAYNEHKRKIMAEYAQAAQTARQDVRQHFERSYGAPGPGSGPAAGPASGPGASRQA